MLLCSLTPLYDVLLLNVQWAPKKRRGTYPSMEAGFHSAGSPDDKNYFNR